MHMLLESHPRGSSRLLLRRLSSSSRARAAVQSRRHLEYQGEDGASIFERARETQDRRAQQAMQSATDHLMPKEAIEAREEHMRAIMEKLQPG